MLASPPRPREDLVLTPRLYVERVVIVPPFAAEAAFDLLLDLRAEGEADVARYPFRTRGGELVLHGPVHLPERRASAVYPVRVVDGWITSRFGVYRRRVELEFLRWSERAAALGLRPVGHRHHPRGFGPYLRIGGEAMTLLRDEIEAWAKSWIDARSA
jgi:hypothetical protein